MHETSETSSPEHKESAESFANWRIYWLALAWLVEETVRYGLLFW